MKETTTIPCAHPKIEAIVPTQGENLIGFWVEAKKKVQMCEQGCGYMETLKMISFGKVDKHGRDLSA